MPVFLGKRSTLFDYFPTASLAMDVGVDAERGRFLALAADASRGPQGKKETGNQALVPQAVWNAAVKARRPIDVAATAGTRVIRFTGNPNPVRAMNAEIADAMKKKSRVVVCGFGT